MEQGAVVGRRTVRFIVVHLLMAAFFLLGGAAAHADEGDGSPADWATVNGSVALRDPVALPPGTLLTVILEDVSRADVPAVMLAQTQLEVQAAPIAFSLVYPTSAVQPGSVYAARARLTLGERLLFTTTQRNEVDVLDPSPIELVVDPVPATEPMPTSDTPLTDTYWKLIEVDGRPIEIGDGIRQPQLVLNRQDGRFTGSGGVNRMMGGYSVDGDSLSFSQVAATMMAGPPEAMQQEQAIVGALGLVRGFRLTADRLTLLDASGAPILQAVAVALN